MTGTDSGKLRYPGEGGEFLLPTDRIFITPVQRKDGSRVLARDTREARSFASVSRRTNIENFVRRLQRSGVLQDRGN